MLTTVNNTKLNCNIKLFDKMLKRKDRRSLYLIVGEQFVDCSFIKVVDAKHILLFMTDILSIATFL